MASLACFNRWLTCISSVSRILSQLEQGDPQVAEQLLPLVYEELRKLAAMKLAQKSRTRPNLVALPVARSRYRVAVCAK